MRILHIIATLNPQAGGPSNSVRRIVEAYNSIGSQGEVLTLDDPNSPFLKNLQFKVHALGPVQTKYGYSSRLVPWLTQERHRFDGVVVHGLWQYIGVTVRRAIEGRLPYVIFSHGMMDPYFKRAYPLKHLKKMVYWLGNEFWLLRNAHRVLFTSKSEAENATKSFWPRRWNERVVPYGSSVPAGDPKALAEAFLNTHPSLMEADGSPRRYLLFLGRIHSKKGCDLLLQAFIHCAGLAPDLHLVFAGPEAAGSVKSEKLGLASTGPVNLKGGLIAATREAGLANRVHWTGMLEGDQKWGAFHACEAFCLPSHQENFGIAVAEALACGKPVLLSDKVNIWQEIFDDGAALVGEDTTEGTQATLERWIALTPAERLKMSECAFDCFRRRYDMQANASGIIEIFAEAAAAGSVERNPHLEGRSAGQFLPGSDPGVAKHLRKPV